MATEKFNLMNHFQIWSRSRTKSIKILIAVPGLHSFLIKIETISDYLRFPELGTSLGLNNSLRKQPTFCDATNGFPRNDV